MDLTLIIFVVCLILIVLAIIFHKFVLRTAKDAIRFIRGESPDRPAPATLITDDGRLVPLVLDTWKRAAVSPEKDSTEAWQIDSRNTFYDPESKSYMMLIDEQSAWPIELWYVNPGKWSWDEIKRIWQNTRKQAEEKAALKAITDLQSIVMLAAILGLFGIILVIILFYFIQTGDVTATWNKLIGH